MWYNKGDGRGKSGKRSGQTMLTDEERQEVARELRKQRGTLTQVVTAIADRLGLDESDVAEEITRIGKMTEEALWTGETEGQP